MISSRLEGCTACGWRGSYGALMLSGGAHDQCPDCSERGTMTTYYLRGAVEVREGELTAAEQQQEGFGDQ